MIALDQLIKYHEEFSKIYKLMGLNVNLNSIINLENKRKEFQLEYENLRATSNKLCSKMSSLKKQNKNVLGELEKIKKINKEIKTLENKLKYYERKINLKLKHLHNIPDFWVSNYLSHWSLWAIRKAQSAYRALTNKPPYIFHYFKDRYFPHSSLTDFSLY